MRGRVEAIHGPQQGALARATAANQGDELAGQHGQRDVGQDHASAAHLLAQVDRVQAVAAAHGRGQCPRLQVVNQLIGADLHHGPLGQRQPGDDALAVDERTVGAAQVADDEAAVRLAANLGMTARDGRMIEMHLARRVAADDRLLQLGHLLHTQWPGMHPATDRPLQRQTKRVAGQVADAQHVPDINRARRLGRHL